MSHVFTLGELRAAARSGGIRSIILQADGPTFSVHAITVEYEDMQLVSTRKKEPRLFLDPRNALSLLREIGIEKAEIDVEKWQPERASEVRQSRPDRSIQMKAAHEAAELKSLLEERLRQADDPNTVWHDHDQLFDELEAGLAD